MKSYFAYKFTSGCGFPSVTLHGEREDWEDLLERAEKFAASTGRGEFKFGKEVAAGTLLTKAIGKMVESFDRPDSRDVKDFWMSAGHWNQAGGSGDRTQMLSGWLTAFAYWTKEGQKQKDYLELPMFMGAGY